jgi:hypothetical protein
MEIKQKESNINTESQNQFMAEKPKTSTSIDAERERKAKEILKRTVVKVDKILEDMESGKIKLIDDNSDDFKYSKTFDNASVEFVRNKAGTIDDVGFSVPEGQSDTLEAELTKAIEANKELDGKIWTEEGDWKVSFMTDRKKENVDALLKIFESYLPHETIKKLKTSVSER